MLADLGVSPNNIQAAGRWPSEAFRIYVRKNPFLLQNLIFGRLSLPLLPLRQRDFSLGRAAAS
jgi:hypothetical protein